MDSAFQELLLPLLLLWPLAAAVWVGVRWTRRGAGSAGFSVFAAGATLAAAVLLAFADGTVSVSLPALLGAIELRADPASRTLALVAAFVWFCASLHAVGYLRGDPAAGRLRATVLVLLSANLGVFLAGDWVTLLICFEVLGLAGVLLVVHDGSEAARRATVKYFWMTLAGGVALLAGIVLWRVAAGSAAISPLPDTASARWAAALVLAGFGVKAGMLGFHVWLPDAHSVAPAPASALLSGIMIKAGAYGVFRCLGALADPASAPALAADFGTAVLALALAGMLIGAIAALGQQHAKRLLAWSSISQMGFILAALAAAALAGSHGADARAAGLMHAINHALFKSALFLAVGALVHAAGTGDLARLGGRLRASPVLAAGLLVAVAGIVGVPGFNGFASKTLVHHALAELGDHDARLAPAEWIYYAASAGTAAMFVRLLLGLFRAAPDEARPAPLPASVQWAAALPAVFVVAIGLAPGWTLQRLVLPATGGSGALHFSTADYAAPFALLAIGAALVLAIRARGWLAWRPPTWVTIDGAYRALGRAVLRGCSRFSMISARLREGAQSVLLAACAAARRGWARGWSDRPRIVALGTALRTPRDSLYRQLDEQRDRIVARALHAAAGDGVRHGGAAQRERLLDATRHYAGWLATRLLNAGIRLGGEAGRRLAASDEAADRLARCALEMARADVESGHEARALDRADGALESLLGPHSEAPVQPMPLRSWLQETGSVLFHLATAPARSHWPVSESFAHGASASRLRAVLHRLTRDPGVGLAVAVLLMVLVFLLSRG